jgi:hypothetical protein
VDLTLIEPTLELDDLTLSREARRGHFDSARAPSAFGTSPKSDNKDLTVLIQNINCRIWGRTGGGRVLQVTGGGKTVKYEDEQKACWKQL